MSKPVTRSASKEKAKTATAVHEAEAASPTPKSLHIRRRKSAPATTENEADDHGDLEEMKGKDKMKSADKAEPVSRMNLDGLREKLGEETEDFTVKLHPTVFIHI